MLYLGYVFVHFLWKLGFNPDNNSIPILTALADLFGSLMFAGGFLFLSTLQDPNAVSYLATAMQANVNQSLIATSSMNSTTARIVNFVTTTVLPSTLKSYANTTETFLNSNTTTL